MNNADPEDSASLLDEIRRSDAARVEAANDRVVDGLLRASAALSSAGKPDTAADVLGQIRAEHRGGAVLPDRPERRFAVNPVFVRSLAALAAGLLVVAGLWWVSESLVIKPPATVEASGDVVIRRGQRAIPVAGTARLYNRDTLETGRDARAVVRYAGEHTFVNLRADSRLKLDRRQGAKRLFLESGSLLADVAPQPAGRPMVVETPQASLRVEGTQFRLRSDASGSQLQVTDGKVSMTRLSDLYALEVPAGCSLALGRTRIPAHLLPIEQAVFGHLRSDQISEPGQSLRLAQALAVNTLTYEVSLGGVKPPDRLKQAVTAAHSAGLRFFARVDIQSARRLNMSQAEFTGLLQNRLASLVEEYDLDGVYFANALIGQDESQVVSLLNPVYQYMAETQPGTALLVGYPSDPNT